MYQRFVILLGFLISTTGLWARSGIAQPQGELELSLDDCIRIALNENPTIKINDMELERLDYSRKEVIGQLLPTVNFTGTYTRNVALQTIYINSASMSGMGGGASGSSSGSSSTAGESSSSSSSNNTSGMKMGRDNNYNVGFSATIPLVMPQLWKSIRLSENQILQNMETARANKLSLVNQVKNAYYALLLAYDSRRVLEASHATAKAHAEVYQKQYELGTASEYDVLRANVEVTNLEPSILEAENVISQLKLQLKLLMGMDVRLEMSPSQHLDDFKGMMYDRAMALTDTTLTANTSLKSLDLKTDYLRKSLDMQKASFYPTLSGTANYMWNSMSNGNPFRNFRWSGVSAVAVTLSIPLFTGGQRYHRVKQAEIALKEMRWQRENLERSLHIQVQTQLDNITKSIKQIESNNAGVTQAEKANQIMQESFRIGAATFIQLRDTDDALLSARLSYYQAIYNYLVAQSDLEHVLGNCSYVAENK